MDVEIGETNWKPKAIAVVRHLREKTQFLGLLGSSGPSQSTLHVSFNCIVRGGPVVQAYKSGLGIHVVDGSCPIVCFGLI